MKHIFLPLVLFFSLLILSCSSEDYLTENKSLTEERLINHLKNRNENYVFYQQTSLEYLRRPPMIPDPIYFDTLEEMDEFLDKIDKISGTHNSNMHYLVDYIPDNGVEGQEEISIIMKTDILEE